jgi:hypothetical protein
MKEIIPAIAAAASSIASILQFFSPEKADRKTTTGNGKTAQAGTGAETPAGTPDAAGTIAKEINDETEKTLAPLDYATTSRGRFDNSLGVLRK